jgi:hypothetical protein
LFAGPGTEDLKIPDLALVRLLHFHYLALKRCGSPLFKLLLFLSFLHSLWAVNILNLGIMVPLPQRWPETLDLLGKSGERNC